MALTSSTRLIEFGALGAVVAFGGGPVIAAIAYLGGRIFGTLLTGLALKRATPWLSFGVDAVSVGEIRRLSTPAFASLAFPLGNALNIQGMRLVVGLALGPAAVAMFAPLRTLSNLGRQPREVVNRLIEPELGVAFGSGNTIRFAQLFLRGSQAAFWLCLLVVGFLALVAPWFVPFWTDGALSLSWPVFAGLLAASIVNSVWFTALMVPYATNRHTRIAIFYTGVYGGGALTVGFFAASAAGLTGAASALLAVEGVMAAYVVPKALRMSGQTWRAWFSTTFQPPSLSIVRRCVFS